jgi:SAM-dependent methyltransferase
MTDPKTETDTSTDAPAYRARGQYQGKTAADYDADRQRTRYDRFKWGREQERLVATLRRLAPRGRILDVPTGTGRLLDAIGSVASEVVGADISLDMLGLAADGRRPVPLLASEAERLPFPDDSFDLVVSIRFFQHLPESSIIPILTEMLRVSRQGALIQAPVSKPTSTAIKTVVDAARFALHRGSGPRPPLRAARPAHRYFPLPVSEFEALLGRSGMALASSEYVTWPGAQLTLMHVTPR